MTVLSDWKPEEEVGKQVMKAQNPKIPGMPKFLFVRPIDGIEKNVEDQELLQCGIRIILYLLMHSRLQ